MHQRCPITLATTLVFLASSALGETYVVRAPARVKASPAELLGSQAVGERFCNTLHCVVYASHGDEKARITALAAGRSIELEALLDADKLFFQNATFDVPSSRFDSPFPGDQDAGADLSVGQFVVVFKSHPTSEWLDELRKRGLTPLEPIPTMGYLVYGPREALPGLTSFKPVRAIVPIHPGIKRFNVDERLPDDDDLPKMTTVVAVTDHVDLVTDLLRGASGVEPIVSIPSPTVTSLIASLSRIDAFNLSRLPEVVSVRRNTDTAGPSDERATRIIGGSWQTPDSSWQLTLPGNSSTPRYWDGFLTQLGSLGTAPNTVDFYLRSQTIGFLDTGIDGGLQEAGASYCPPFLRDTSGNCRLVFTQDVSPLWANPNTLADDVYYHGSLTTSIATGFAGSSSPGRDSGQYAFTQGVAQGAPVGIVDIFSLCDTTVPRPFRDWNGDSLFDFDDSDVATRLRYAIAELSDTTGSLPDASARNTIPPAATLFNHSWNDSRVIGYDELARILDRATRRLNTVSYSFPGSGQVITGASGAETPSLHVVSAGNIRPTNLVPPPPEYYLVDTPGTAKNVITVGATENYNQENYTPGCESNNLGNANNPRTIGSSSRIGFSNQRLKPDLVAPGTRSYGFRSTRLASPCPGGSTTCNLNLLGGSTDPRYAWASGTSFSAPAVSGAAALARAWLQAVGVGGTPPSPALLKATLIATSRNLAPCATGCVSCSSCSYCGDMRPAPDKYQGWGGVSLDRLFRPTTNYFFFDQGRTFNGNGQTWSQTLSIVNRTKAIGIALVWSDRASIDTVNTNQNLTNDLDLEVSFVQGGVTHRYYGNNFYTSIDSCNRDGFSMLDPTPTYDRKNNVEKVLIRDNEIPVGVTQITVRVSSFALTGDGFDPDGSTNRQDFAIMVENAH